MTPLDRAITPNSTPSHKAMARRYLKDSLSWYDDHFVEIEQHLLGLLSTLWGRFQLLLLFAEISLAEAKLAARESGLEKSAIHQLVSKWLAGDIGAIPPIHKLAMVEAALRKLHNPSMGRSWTTLTKRQPAQVTLDWIEYSAPPIQMAAPSSLRARSQGGPGHKSARELRRDKFESDRSKQMDAYEIAVAARRISEHLGLKAGNEEEEEITYNPPPSRIYDPDWLLRALQYMPGDRTVIKAIGVLYKKGAKQNIPKVGEYILSKAEQPKVIIKPVSEKVHLAFADTDFENANDLEGQRTTGGGMRVSQSYLKARMAAQKVKDILEAEDGPEIPNLSTEKTGE